MTRYKIGEIARLFGLTTQALRFYEQEGVIIPQKSNNGTRYFDTADIIRLLAFKKYRLSEFSIQDIAMHFKRGSLNNLVTQLDMQSDALIAQSEILLKRARAIRNFERLLREAQDQTDVLVLTTTPDIYFYTLSFDQLNQMTESQRKTFTAFVNAMPDTSMCFTCPSSLDSAPEFRFAASSHEATAWSLPLQDAIHFPPTRCVRIHVRVPGHPWDKQYLHSILKQVCAAGYQLHPNQLILGQHLASETIDKTIYLYGTLYVPIL